MQSNNSEEKSNTHNASTDEKNASAFTKKEISKEQKKQLEQKKKEEKLEKLRLKREMQMKEQTEKTDKKDQTDKKEKKESGSKGYDPAPVERKWIEYWKTHSAFTPRVSEENPEMTGTDRKKFSIVIPPPNITGSLHIGHSMAIAIEDCVVRYKRNTGHETLYLPGLDHAGIATQNVVLRSTGPVDRPAFLKAAYDWSDRYGSRIFEQFDRMGTSLDYSRKRFTLDAPSVRAVSTAFIELHRKGLIYRDNKMVNWCGALKTVVSDLEVDYKDIAGGAVLEADGGSYRFGVMYYVKYRIISIDNINKDYNKEYYKDDIENINKLTEMLNKHASLKEEDLQNLPFVVVGTTRPETILGDSAICINPADERFSDFERIFSSGSVLDVMNSANRNVGINNDNDNNNENTINNNDNNNDINDTLKNERKNKYKTSYVESDEIKTNSRYFAVNPVTGEIIRIIYDAQADMGLGTGVLKVTPAHDPVDFKLGKKHDLPFKKIMDASNSIVYRTDDDIHINIKNNDIDIKNSDINKDTSGSWNGMKRFECRKKILEFLKNKEHLVSEEPHSQVLPFCSRSGDLIEPMVKSQWWMDCRGMAQKAIDGVRSGEIRLVPEEAKATWFRWLENIRDWCLSRQLWWGHRIPAYRCIKNKNNNNDSDIKINNDSDNKDIKTFDNDNDNDSEKWVVAEDETQALAMAKEQGYDAVEQDEDVLDTWFSSGLWPFSTMGWPDKTADMKRFFPNSILETGSDILFFWVARMVMMSYELLGTRPFDTILLHGLVRDSHGRKMSKSLGNVVDPLYVIDGISLEEMRAKLAGGNIKDPRELKRASDALGKDYPNGIPKCGTDALRFALLSYTNGIKDINLDILRVQGYSRLCNKIFNAFKYIKSRLDTSFNSRKDIVNSSNVNSRKDIKSNSNNVNNDIDIKSKDNSNSNGYIVNSSKDIVNSKDIDIGVRSMEISYPMHEKWIIRKFNKTLREQHQFLEAYNFMAATQSIHSFFIYDFCDIFIEVSKSGKSSQLLLKIFKGCMEMLNPYMPFITEEFHYDLFGTTVGSYPEEILLEDEGASDAFEDVVALAKAVRTRGARMEMFAGGEYLQALARGKIEFVSDLSGSEKLEKYQLGDRELMIEYLS
ncbi:valyl-tRNA synthetase [Enteropsectra breve]|nr:valyl-tRNA synthetase [Enteropsectra breve]